MKQIFLILMCIAAVMVMTACGGGNSKKQSGDASETTTTKAESQKKSEDNTKWPSNDFTKQLPKPDIAIKSAYSTGQNSEVYMVTFDQPTLEQVKAYGAKVKAAGFNVDANESGASDYYSYSAKNAAGWKIYLSLTRSQSSITITEP